MSIKKQNIALLGSGQGSHLEGLNQCVNTYSEQLSIELVISDCPDAAIVEKAHALAIPSFVVTPSKDRALSDRLIDEILKAYQIQWVLLIGYLRRLSHWLCQQWSDRLYNIHPSLLPDYANMAGDHVHQAVIKDRPLITGCTLHKVSAKIDAGEIVHQKQCPIEPEDNVSSIKQKVFQLEQATLKAFINQLAGDYDGNST